MFGLRVFWYLRMQNTSIPRGSNYGSLGDCRQLGTVTSLLFDEQILKKSESYLGVGKVGAG